MLLIEEYAAAVNEKVARETAAIIAGGITSFEDYKRRVGYIAGLRAAITILEELVKTKPKEERI